MANGKSEDRISIHVLEFIMSCLSNNRYHTSASFQEGDALPELRTKEQVIKAVQRAGLELLEAEDLALTSPIPWWSILATRWSLYDLKSSPPGRWLTHIALMGMEMIGLASKGSVKTHRMLCKGADALALGGKEGIFSPMVLIVAEKPV